MIAFGSFQKLKGIDVLQPSSLTHALQAAQNFCIMLTVYIIRHGQTDQ
jgi:hypothetical protein